MIFFQSLVKKLFTSTHGLYRSSIYSRLFKALLAAVTLNFSFGAAFYFFESEVQKNLTFWDSLWWSMVTMTTVGYGDYYAQTTLGRYLVSYPCMLLGIGIFGYFVGALAESMVEKMARFRRGNMVIKFSNHIILCNCPNIQKVINLVEELRDSSDFANRKIVIVTEAFDEIPDSLAKLHVHFVKGSPCDEDTMIRANFQACDGLIVMEMFSSEDHSDAYTLAITSLITMLKKQYNCNPRVVVETNNKKTIKMLEYAGADGVVAAEGISDRLIIQEFLYPGIHDIVQQIISNSIGSQFYIFETRLQNKKFKDIQLAILQHEAELQVIGVVRGEEEIINPAKDFKIEEKDKLIVLANSKADFETIESDILGEMA